MLLQCRTCGSFSAFFSHISLLLVWTLRGALCAWNLCFVVVVVVGRSSDLLLNIFFFSCSCSMQPMCTTRGNRCPCPRFPYSITAQRRQRVFRVFSVVPFIRLLVHSVIFDDDADAADVVVVGLVVFPYSRAFFSLSLFFSFVGETIRGRARVSACVSCHRAWAATTTANRKWSKQKNCTTTLAIYSCG